LLPRWSPILKAVNELRQPAPRWFVLGLVVILAAGAAVRAWYWQEARALPDYASPMLDARYHDYWARAIITGDWTPPEGQNNPLIQQHPYVRPPLYPYFLALVYTVFDGSFDAARVAQFLLGLVSAALAAWLAGRWFGWVSGLFSAAVLCFYWSFPYYETQLVEPALVIPLLLAWTGLTVSAFRRFSYARLLGSGLLLGVIVLGRPNALLLVPAIALWMLWIGWSQKLRFRHILLAEFIFGAGVLLTVSPAVVRNLMVSGELVPVTAVGGQNLYLANNPLADGYSGIAPDIRNWSSFDHPRLVAELSLQAGRRLSFTEASSVWSQRARQYMVENPGRVAALTFKKILLLIGPKEITVDREDEIERRKSWRLSALPAGFSWILAGAVLSLLIMVDAGGIKRLLRHEVMIPLLVLVVFAASYVPFTITGRYRIPLIPLLVLLMSMGLPHFIVWANERKWKPLVSWLLAGVLLYAVISPNYADYKPSEARWNLSRGLAHGRAGQVETAARYLGRAIELEPEYAYARFNYGVALSFMDQPEEAIRQMLESARIEPLAATWQSIASARKAQGDYEDAEEALREAIRLAPLDASILNDLGILYAETDQLEKAIGRFLEAVKLDPFYFDAMRNLAVGLESAGRDQESTYYYEKAVALNDRDASVIYRLATRYGLAGRYREAVSALYRAIELQPDNAGWLGALAWIRATHPDASLRDGREALALAARAVSNVDEGEPSALVVLAAAYAEVGRMGEARNAISRALQGMSGDPEMLTSLKEQQQAYLADRPFRDATMKSLAKPEVIAP
jgi:tetratricopeptide (TPR) repeat protein/4-amino-4-deoxy-L-arabinose transferase-like glycosyltransferase